MNDRQTNATTIKKAKKKVVWNTEVDCHYVESFKKEYAISEKLLKTLKKKEQALGINGDTHHVAWHTWQLNLYEKRDKILLQALEGLLRRPNIISEVYQELADQPDGYRTPFSKLSDSSGELSKTKKSLHVSITDLKVYIAYIDQLNSTTPPITSETKPLLNNPTQAEVDTLCCLLVYVKTVLWQKEAVESDSQQHMREIRQNLDRQIRKIDDLTAQITRAEESTKSFLEDLYTTEIETQTDNTEETAQLPPAEKLELATEALSQSKKQHESTQKLLLTLEAKLASRLHDSNSTFLRDFIHKELQPVLNIEEDDLKRQIKIIDALRKVGQNAQFRLEKRGFFNNLFSRKNKEIYESLSILANTSRETLEADLAIALLPLLDQKESVEITMNAYTKKIKQTIKKAQIAVTPSFLKDTLPPEKIKIAATEQSDKTIVKCYFEEPFEILSKKIGTELTDKKNLLNFLAEQAKQSIPNSIQVSALATELSHTFSLTTLKEYLNKLTEVTQEEPTSVYDRSKNEEIERRLAKIKTDISETYREVSTCFPGFFSCCSKKQTMPPGVQATKMVLDNDRLTNQEKAKLIKAIGIYKNTHPCFGQRSQETIRIYETAAAAA